MNKGRILGILLSGALFVTAGCSHDTSVTYKNYSIQGYNNDEIVLVTPTARVGGFASLYNSGGIESSDYMTQLEKEGKKNCTIINGTYYATTGKTFQPAGTLILYNGIDHTDVIPSTIDPAKDPNLHIHAHYGITNNQLSFDDTKAPVRGIGFFAGPMILINNEINPELIDGTGHRNGDYERTFMIQLADHKTVLGISKKKTSLTELAQTLQNIYTGQFVSVLNLDGGPSTTLASDKISFNTTDQKLPLWFSICEK